MCVKYRLPCSYIWPKLTQMRAAVAQSLCDSDGLNFAGMATGRRQSVTALEVLEVDLRICGCRPYKAL